MSRNKCETLSIRITAAIKDLIRRAAGRAHRSVASMLEVLPMAHAGQAGIKARMSGRKQVVSALQNTPKIEVRGELWFFDESKKPAAVNLASSTLWTLRNSILTYARGFA